MGRTREGIRGFIKLPKPKITLNKEEYKEAHQRATKRLNK